MSSTYIDVECDECGASFDYNFDLSDYYSEIPDDDIIQMVEDNDLELVIVTNYVEGNIKNKLSVIKSILGIQQWQSNERVLEEIKLLF
jgi:hypothetical protein